MEHKIAGVIKKLNCFLITCTKFYADCMLNYYSEWFDIY